MSDDVKIGAILDDFSEAHSIAVQSLLTLQNEDVLPMRRQIILTAKSSNRLDIWLVVFRDYPEMQRAFIETLVE